MNGLHCYNEIYMFVMSSISLGLPNRCLLLVSKFNFLVLGLTSLSTTFQSFCVGHLSHDTVPGQARLSHCSWAVGRLIRLTLKAPITTAADDKFCNIFF